MKKILVVIDMQNDFIDGALKNEAAQEILPKVVDKIKSYPKSCVFATRDTHSKDYLSTQEGKILPIEHCIKNTDGWQLNEKIAPLILNENIVDKPTFASFELAERMAKIAEIERIAIELCGVCTDICVVSNALLLKARLPETPICLDSKCCAGTNVQNHDAALLTMKNNQILVQS